MQQTGPIRNERSILQYAAHTHEVYQVSHGDGRIEMGVVLQQACSESQWSVLLGYLTVSTNDVLLKRC